MPGKAFNIAAEILKSSSKLINYLLRPVYKVYEAWLWAQISEGRKPNHVAIIPDGNRRWAKQIGMNPIFGHEAGYQKLKQVLNWLWEAGIKAVTIYAMSYENCINRPEDERRHIFNLLERGVQELLEGEYIDRHRLRVKFIGRLDMVPSNLLRRISELEKTSEGYNEHFLNIAVCYGGRQEIVSAVKKLVVDVVKGKVKLEDIDEDIFRRYLQTSHMKVEGVDDPDLVIRTSGELRVSNFLLWQIAYSELYFCEAYWPEFRKIDLWRAIRSYQKRDRRFGR